MALRLTRDLAASASVTSAALVLASLGSLVGAAVIERWVPRVSVARVLVASALGATLGLAALLAARSAESACLALFVLGACAAPHFALLSAAAYDAAPGRPGLVNAASQAFVVLEIALPLIVGTIAARHGLTMALGALVLQPAIVLCAALFLSRMRNRP